MKPKEYLTTKEAKQALRDALMLWRRGGQALLEKVIKGTTYDTSD